NYIYASTNIAVILHGGSDLQKEGTTNESAVKGAREGYFAQKATHEVADKYPGKKFGIINFEFTPPVKNIASILFAEDQQGFVAGLLAAEISKKRNKKVAVVGGASKYSTSQKKVNGFANGVKHACADCTAYCLYNKSFVNENNESQDIFNSISTNKGINVVYNAASITGTTTLKNLTANEIYGIGDTTDEITNWAYGSVPGSENLLTSIVQDYQVVVRGMLKNNFATGGMRNKYAKSKENMQNYIGKIANRQIDVGIDHKSGKSKISPGSTSCTMLEINKSYSSKDGVENHRRSDHDNIDHERKSA
ncbi:10795_t:CDS:2, partial [Ambispora gerdemannii]